MHPIPALDYLNFPSNGIYSNLAIQVNQCFYSMLQRCNDPCPPSSTNPIYELFQGYMRSPVKIDLVGLTIATDFGTLSSLIIVAILGGALFWLNGYNTGVAESRKDYSENHLSDK